LLYLLATSLWAGAVLAESDYRELAESPRIAFSPSPLEALLVVPNDPSFWTDESTDESLASAVARGNDPSLERKSNFRKRKFDLFRTQRNVTILDQEMVLRFRLRAKANETVSLELRF